MKLKDKVVLITASIRGIGLAITKVFAKEGGAVYMAARNLEIAKREADKLNSGCCRVKYVYNDASKPESYVTMTDEDTHNGIQMNTIHSKKITAVNREDKQKNPCK